ncbi:MAG: sigma-70 family RNA polymerase sigma factor [Acidobacteria bacterium]|nr:sigma-70 family RNA polymerase sigma factor [Acidobacteriota bacterium]
MKNTVSSAQETTAARAVSDRELVARAQAGDSSAFEELLRRHEQKVKRLAQYLCHGNAEDGEETSQNALLKAYRHLAGFRGESQFSTWLTRIVINECRMYQRGQRSRPRGLNLDEQLGEAENIPVELVDSSDDPEEQYTRQEFQAILQRCLAEMKELYRMPFVLSQVEGLSNEEMAARLGVSMPTAKTRLLRARQQLGRALAETFCHGSHCYWPGAGSRPSSRIQAGNKR